MYVDYLCYVFCSSFYFFCFFFFQAEDGIRDKLVTGVQTCALPISLRQLLRDEPAEGNVVRRDLPSPAQERLPPGDVFDGRPRRVFRGPGNRRVPPCSGTAAGRIVRPRLRDLQIGRASCRERV